MEHERILGYKLYKTISFLPSTSVFIQPQLLNFLTTTCGTKPNHRMKAKEEGMGKELSIGFEDTSLRLYLNPFLLYHEFSFKEFVALRNLVDIYANNMKFGMQPLLFDPGGWNGVTLVLNEVKL
ncbi:hypothetical protein M9H77_23871 [Catharanthus roseus]|uniref:Uncharacterized protein n=1 Tax=Catharanthus roseus TaxID=4058 RepID=A0ACC0AX97_CATRO|nr:hypothetical protein M9H77_23871 [Catharanthus roseus]